MESLDVVVDDGSALSLSANLCQTQILPCCKWKNKLGTLIHVQRSEKSEAKRTCNPCEMLLMV